MKKLLVLLLLLCLFTCAQAEETLDLRGRTFEGMAELHALLDSTSAPAADLTGVKLTNLQRKALMQRYPHIQFLWTVDVYGLPVTTEETEIDLKGHHISKVSTLCDALDCLPSLRKVKMYNNFTTWQEKELLFNRYPHIQFCFDVHLQQMYHIRTDEVTAFSTLKNGKPPYVRNDQLWWVKMCPNLLALDLGHNIISDLSFLYDAPKLKVLILACNNLTDLTPLACQTDLEYLELFLNSITDVSPLSNLKNLKDLNLCFNQITDVTPLMDLPNLERLWLTQNTGIPQEQLDMLRERYPNTEIVFKSNGATGSITLENGRSAPGWRDHDRYPIIWHMFNHGKYLPWDAQVQRK